MSIKRTTESKALDYALLAIEKNTDVELWNSRLIYEKTLDYMKENNLILEEDLQQQGSRKQTKLRSTIDNLISHKKLHAYLNVSKIKGKRQFTKKRAIDLSSPKTTQTEMLHIVSEIFKSKAGTEEKLNEEALYNGILEYMTEEKLLKPQDLKSKKTEYDISPTSETNLQTTLKDLMGSGNIDYILTNSNGLTQFQDRETYSQKLISNYKNQVELEDRYKEGELLIDIDNVKKVKSFFEEQIMSEYRMILLLDGVESHSVDAFIESIGKEEIINSIEEQGGINALKTQKKESVEDIVVPDNINNYTKLVEEIVELTSKSTDKMTNIAVSNDFDGDGVFGQVAVNGFDTVLKQLGINNVNIINIEASNQKGRGVGPGELEHQKLQNIDKIHMFITTDSNFDKTQFSNDYELPNNLKEAKFRVTDHHHTNGRAPEFLKNKDFFEVNPHLTQNKNQQEISGAALISLIFKEVLKRKTEEGLFFNLELISKDINQVFDRIIYTTNMGDVATNNVQLEPNKYEYAGATEYYNLFNTLNIYKRLQILDIESFKNQLPKEMEEKVVEELWGKIQTQYNLIKLMAQEKKIEKVELLNKYNKLDNSDVTLEDIQDFLLMTTKSFVEKKVEGRHGLMKEILKDFKKVHQEVQQEIVATEKNMTQFSDENITITKYEANTTGYKLIATTMPATTETSMGLMPKYNKNGEIKEVGIVSGRSSLTKEGKEGWEVFGKALTLELISNLEKISKINLTKEDKEELKEIFIFKGHGAAFGGVIKIPSILKKYKINENDFLNIVIKSMTNSITKEKETRKEETNSIYIDQDNIIDLPNILKIYDRMEGYKSSSNLPKIIVKLPQSYENNEDKVYQSMGLFSGEAIITSGELKPGDYIECQFIKGALMMDRVISEKEMEKVKIYNDGEMIDSPHIKMLYSEINNSEEFIKKLPKSDYRNDFINDTSGKRIKGVYVSKEIVQSNGDPKISIDLETTGSNSETDEIYNIGIVVNDGDGNLVKYSVFLNKSLPLASVVLTRITQGFVSEFGSTDDKEIDEILVNIIDSETDRLKALGKEVKVSAHNGMNFDFRMLENKLPSLYVELMEKNKYNLIDTTYIARDAMSQEYGLEIEGTNIRFQDFNGIQELDLKSWLKDFRQQEEGSKLYNILSDESYFEIEKGTDKTERLVYYKEKEKQVILDDLSERTIDKFIKTKLIVKKLPAKFSINLITNLVQTHDILYYMNEAKLQTEHTINEDIFKKVEDKPNLKKILSNHLKEYYFTLSKEKNASILMDKLKNHQLRSEELTKYLENDVQDFLDGITETTSIKDDLLEIIRTVFNKNIEVIDSVYDIIESEAFKKEISKSKYSLTEVEQLIINESIVQSGNDIDNKVIYNEYIENRVITKEDLTTNTEDKTVEQIKKWINKVSLDNIIDNIEKDITIKEIKDLIKQGQVGTSIYYSADKLEEIIEGEIEGEIVTIQEEFLNDNEEKAKITEEIRTILYLITQGYLTNLEYDKITEEEIKIYSDSLNKKTGVPTYLLESFISFIKNDKTLQELVKENFLEEPHQAMEDAKLENMIMKKFMDIFYPYTERERKSKIASASSELVKKTFRKAIRDKKEEDGLKRVPQVFNNAEQDVYIKLKNGESIEREDFEEVKEYLNLKELNNIRRSKLVPSKYVFEKDMKKVLEKNGLDIADMIDLKTHQLAPENCDKIFLKHAEKTKSFSEILGDMVEVEEKKGNEKKNVLADKGYKAKLSLKRAIEVMTYQLLTEFLNQIEMDNLEYLENFIKIEDKNTKDEVLNQLKLVALERENFKKINTDKLEILEEKIKSKYEIQILNKEYQLIDKLRKPINETLMEMKEIQKDEKNPMKQKISLIEEGEFIDSKIEDTLVDIIQLGVFETTSLKEINPMEIEIISGLEKYLNSIVITMDTANILSKENFEEFLNKLKIKLRGKAKHASEELKDNSLYLKGASKPTYERARELMFENIEPVKEKTQEEQTKIITP